MPTDPLETDRPQATGTSYGRAAVAFHWMMFVLVVVVGILGLLHDDWPKATQGFWINIHALLGLLLWFTLLARMTWRFRHAPPALPEGIGTLSRRISSPVHWAL
jgi:cytochrome b561